MSNNKYVFKKAKQSDKKAIYNLYKDLFKLTKDRKRIFGLKDSISKGFVWIFSYDDKIIGFCRARLDEGKSLDYLKFNEIFILPNTALYKIRRFMKFVDSIIIGYGYAKAKITSIDSMGTILEKAGWFLEGKKFKFSNDEEKTYWDKIYIRIIKVIPLNDFGKLNK